MTKQLAIVVSLLAADAAAAPCSKDAPATVAMQVGARGVWMGASDGVMCFVARDHGAIDATRIDAELKALVGGLPADCERRVEVAGDGVSYQDMITVMDRATAAGLSDIALSEPKGLSIRFNDSVKREKKAAHCVAPATGTVTTGTTSVAVGAPVADPRDALARAPVITITKTDVEIGGSSVGTVKALARGKGAIAGLVKTLQSTAKAAPGTTVVIQADQSTPLALLNRTIQSAKQAGFTNVLFAVKSK